MSASPNLPASPAGPTGRPAGLTKPEMPSFLQQFTQQEGIEGASSDDIILPRLVVMQSNSHDVQKSKYAAGDIVVVSQNRVICPSKNSFDVHFVKWQKEFIHWSPRDSGQGMLGKETDENGEIAKKARAQLEEQRRTRIRPDSNTVDTYKESHMWLLFIAGLQEPFVLSLSGGNLKDSKSVLGVMMSKKCPARALKFSCTPTLREKPKPFWVAEFRWDGFCADEALYGLMSDMYKSLSGKVFKADVDETPDAEPVGGNPDEM